MTRKVFSVLASVLWLSLVEGQNKSIKFPKDFKFGVSTSAYQIEGAWVEDDKGMSIWDYTTHMGTIQIPNGANADVAADSYHLYNKDIEILRDLGVHSYKFSISWPRILPNGLKEYVNPKGIAYYNALIDGLIAKGIEPVVGMYHWDLPQNLQEKGGILNDDFPKWFGDYARTLYQHFGDRVKYWMTMNEPVVQCHYGYEIGSLPPMIKLPGRGSYDCTRSFLLAHAKAYHIYDEEFRPSQKGNISLNHMSIYPVPHSNSTDDMEAVDDFMAFGDGIFLHPIMSKTGNYPQRVIDRVALLSAQQGLNSSRLKPLTDKEVKYIKGTTDYLTLNHYYSMIVSRNASLPAAIKMAGSPSAVEDSNLMAYRPIEWSRSNATYLDFTHIYDYAPGFYETLRYMRNTYDDPEIYIIENGFRTAADDSLEDIRIDATRNYLQAVLDAIQDGVRVKGFFYWSLFDNFEWRWGYESKFGLYAVNMSDPARARTPRKTALVYKDIIRSGIIDYNYNPSISSSAKLVTHAIINLAIVVVVFVCNWVHY